MAGLPKVDFFAVAILAIFGATMCRLVLRSRMLISRSGIELYGIRAFQFEWSDVIDWYPSEDGFVSSVRPNNKKVISLATFRSAHGDGKLLKIFYEFAGSPASQV